MLFHMKSAAAAVAVAALGLLIAAPARSTGATAPTYTLGQAAMGAATFNTICAGCHLPTLAGNPNSKPPRPPLTGPVFVGRWQGKTAGDLYAFVSTKMPFGRGGTLMREQYLAVVAYLMQKNGIEPSDHALDPATASRIPLSALH